MASIINVDEIASVSGEIKTFPNIILDVSGDNTYIEIPSGTTLERGSPPFDGAIRWNTDLGVLEIYREGLWRISRRIYDYNLIFKGNLALNLDASNIISYPAGLGNKWFSDSLGTYHALLINSPSYNTANGGYFDFNGTNQYGLVKVTDSNIRPVNAITLECWFKLSSINTKQVFMDLQYGISTNSAFSLFTTDSNWVGGVNILGTFESFSHPFTTTPLQTGQWYQFVYAYNSSSFNVRATTALTSGSNVVTEVSNLENVIVGMNVTGAGIVNDEVTTTTITAIDFVNNTVTISEPATITTSAATLTFSNPPAHYMYINGEFVGLFPIGGTIDQNLVNEFITIGGKYNGPGDNTGIGDLVSGSISTCRLYNAFLTETNVKYNYDIVKTRHGLT